MGVGDALGTGTGKTAPASIDSGRRRGYLCSVITELKVSGWRCLNDTTLTLTPLHALIGPNDSGKSTLLDILWSAYQLQFPDTLAMVELRTDTIRMTFDRSKTPPWDAVRHRGPHLEQQGVRAEFGTARRLRLDPKRMRQPSHLLTSEAFSFEEDGNLLPGVYDAILNRDRDAWDSIEQSVREHFPTVRRLALRPVSNAAKVLEIELLDGTRVPADQMSEGLLYWLAFAALPHVSPTKLLLIEEPENGLHPARIAEVMRVLRQLSERGTQVVMATHSPLVVNELKPEEVSVVTRTPEAGTKANRVSEIPSLDQLLEAFSLGELWLAFADGKEEAGLFAQRGEAIAS